MFSLSCAWNGKMHKDAYSMVRQINELGIDRIELSFALTKEFVCDIISMKDAGEVEVASVHNFCPIPEGATAATAGPDYYSLASLDEIERRKAIESTKQTISTARRLDAKAVILHLGKVNIKDRTKELAALLRNRFEYDKLKSLMVEDRRAHAEPHLDKAITSLEELSRFAKGSGLVFGIETRYYYYEIPSFDEIGIILEKFKGDDIGYWHDTGHAQLFENIGIRKHIDFLADFHDRMIGVHLNDIKGIKDHLAPLQGELDFSILKPYLNEKMLLVLEPHQPAGAGEIKKGIKYLERIFQNTQ